MNWTIAKPLVAYPKPFAKHAIRAGYPVVAGLSGTSYLNSLFMHEMQLDTPTFDAGAGMLNVLAFLTFDGGHSFNEAMAVYEASNNLPRTKVSADYDAKEWRKWQTNAVHYRFRYNQLTQLPRSDAAKMVVTNLLQEALEGTVDYFKKYDVAQEDNKAAIDKMSNGGYALPNLDALDIESGEESDDD